MVAENYLEVDGARVLVPYSLPGAPKPVAWRWDSCGPWERICSAIGTLHRSLRATPCRAVGASLGFMSSDTLRTRLSVLNGSELVSGPYLGGI